MNKEDWKYLIKKELWAIGGMIIGAYVGTILAYIAWYGGLIHYNTVIHDFIIGICIGLPGIKICIDIILDKELVKRWKSEIGA